MCNELIIKEYVYNENKCIGFNAKDPNGRIFFYQYVGSRNKQVGNDEEFLRNGCYTTDDFFITDGVSQESNNDALMIIIGVFLGIVLIYFGIL